jgi:hypothetical protein
MHNLHRGKKWPKNVGYVYDLKKTPKVNYNPMGENLPNLVTLATIGYLGQFNVDKMNFDVRHIGLRQKKNVVPIFFT